MENVRRDIHSFSNPEQIRVRNVDLDCDVFFDRKIISGIATLGVERRVSSGAPPLIVDTRDLKIESVETADDSGTFCVVGILAGRERPDPRGAADDSAAGHRDQGPDTIFDQSAGVGAAVARSAADGRQEAAVSVHAVAGD